MKYINLLKIHNTNYHILAADKNKSNEFISELKQSIPHQTHLGIIEGTKIVDKKSLFEEFSVAFKFPDYFGHNWDAFDECINDLEWLNSNSYVIVITDFEEITLDQNDFTIFIDMLKKAVREWTSGRKINPQFATPPTPFHSIFVVREARVQDIIGLLKTKGIYEVDIIN
jgi:RNAse (barnase) inhibitor barstar